MDGDNGNNLEKDGGISWSYNRVLRIYAGEGALLYLKLGLLRD